MYGYRAVQGLDVTFEVLGHLISKDGTVIGLVSKAAWGRMIKPSDAALGIVRGNPGVFELNQDIQTSCVDLG